VTPGGWSAVTIPTADFVATVGPYLVDDQLINYNYLFLLILSRPDSRNPVTSVSFVSTDFARLPTVKPARHQSRNIWRDGRSSTSPRLCMADGNDRRYDMLPAVACSLALVGCRFPRNFGPKNAQRRTGFGRTGFESRVLTP
jgi:hypothetical protein